jgi:hypothetical protein
MPQSSQPDIQYAALSYCWGPDEACSEIRIHPQQSNTTPDNGFHFSWKEGSAKIKVKSNLYAALQQFRETEQEVYLWVDALCINQEDKKEKAHQISKMQEIYNNATNVCIWLGPATLTSEVALPFVKEVLNLEQFDALIKDGSSRHKWHALANLMRNRWFSRRWVIQELTLARNATVHCGATAVHWNDFADAVALFVTKLDKIKELFPQSRQHGTGSDTLDDIRVLGANVLVHTSNYLFRKSPDGEILERLRTMETLMSTLLPFEATDPKDTIYAVLSLAKDEPGHKIIPDYSKDLAEVCTDFIKSCVESSGSLDIICRHWAPIKKDFGHPKYSNFPSWIPCISGSAFGAPEDALNGRANGDSFVGDPGRCNYNASLGFPPSSVRFGLREDNHARDPRSATLSAAERQKFDGTMYVEGFTLDTIAEVAPRAAFGLIFREGLDMAGWPEDHTHILERIPDELWRTLVADRGPDGSSPPSWYHRACLYCLAKRDTSGDINTGALITNEDSPEMMVEFLKRVQSTIWNRKFFKSARGIKGKRLFGLAPKNARDGDELCILFGCSVPVVLRPHRLSIFDHRLGKRRRISGTTRKASISEDSFDNIEFIGECYIYGMMDGEAKDIYGQNPDSRTRTYKLV